MDNALLRQARQFLENERAFGLDALSRHVPAGIVSAPVAPECTPAEKEASLEWLRKEFPLDVLGGGDPDARLFFVGETIGTEESGLLIKIIEAMKLSLDTVYVAGCGSSLTKQIEIVRPKIVCALGQRAVECLLGKGEKIEDLRGRYLNYAGLKIMPTYHPADLLKKPDDKKLVWNDMKIIMKDLGLA